MIFPFLMNFLSYPYRTTCQNPEQNTAIEKATLEILKEQGHIQKAKKTKPVYFFGRYDLLSFKLGGSYLIEGLKTAGITAAPGYCVPIENIRDSILVFIKTFPAADHSFLKKNGNKIIFDAHDSYDGLLKPAFNLTEFADYIIFPNQNIRNQILSLGKELPANVVLYGYADPAVSLFFLKNGYKTLDCIKCCYFGKKRNLDVKKLRGLRLKIPVTILPNSSDGLNELHLFNTHIDLRKHEEDSLYKPLTKILVAAECASNIIIEKTPRVLELFPQDYPFFVSHGKNYSTIKNLFNTAEWKYALSIMAAIRERYTFRSHVMSIIKILEDLS